MALFSIFSSSVLKLETEITAPIESDSNNLQFQELLPVSNLHLNHCAATFATPKCLSQPNREKRD